MSTHNEAQSTVSVTTGDNSPGPQRQAAAACEDINARAFTVGNHVAFNRGEYAPDSPDGQHVIAHELAHVRQQNADISISTSQSVRY